jgi:hypothetical protein
MSDLAQYRLTSRAVVERATLQRDAGRIEPKDVDLVASTAAGLDGILATFDAKVSTDRSLYRDDLLPGRIRDAAVTARAALQPFIAKADRAQQSADEYADRVMRLAKDARGAFVETSPQPFTALDVARITHLWGIFAPQDNPTLRVRYLVEVAKATPDRIVTYALESLPERDVVDERTREQAQAARARALGIDGAVAGAQATAAAMRLLIDEAHRVVDAIAGVPPSAFRSASGASEDISSTIL